MQAAWYEELGSARGVLRVGELPDPEPGPGEVLVRVRASGVNPSDYKKRAGWGGLEMMHPRVVPHSDGAGVVVAVGPGVPETRRGERVWLWNAQGPERAFGTAAELVALPSEQAPRLPDGVDFAVGAALGVPGCTAHRAVFADGSVEGMVVLVAGGAGAVGSYAVQLARWGGARVLATVSSEEKADHARRAGAEVTIDYRREDVVSRVMEETGGAGVDRIVEVDLGANLPVDVEVIGPNGVIASYSSTSVPEPTFPYYPLAFKGVTLQLVQGYLLPPAARRRAVVDLNRLLAEGRLWTAVAGRFPLREIAAAHEAAEAGDRIGKLVVEPGVGT